MADRPILFSAPMIRALLSSSKTQTRRVIKATKGAPIEALKPFDPDVTGAPNDPLSWGIPFGEDGACHMSLGAWPEMWCRFGIGDRLWVRENFAICPKSAWALPKTVAPDDADMAAYYQADFDRCGRPRWKPSIHMPRWASRLTLIVTDVRVQRLQDISEVDAVAEGVAPFRDTGAYISPKHPDGKWRAGDNAYTMYRDLWNAINGPDAWEANPWVSAISFSVHQQNIDAMEKADG